MSVTSNATAGALLPVLFAANISLMISRFTGLLLCGLFIIAPAFGQSAPGKLLDRQIALSGTVFLYHGKAASKFTMLKGEQPKPQDLRGISLGVEDKIVFLYREPAVSYSGDREETSYSGSYGICEVAGQRIVTIDGQTLTEQEALAKIAAKLRAAEKER